MLGGGRRPPPGRLLGRTGRGGQVFGFGSGGRSLAGDMISPPPEDFGERTAPRRPAPEGVYGAPSPFGTKTYSWQPAKLLRDRLYDRMCDWSFHTLQDLDGWMPEREWVRAMLDLVHFGWAFDRQGKTLRLRKAFAGEPRQSVVDLLSGITVSSEVGGASAPPPAAQVREGAEEVPPFPMGGDDAEEVATEDEMVLDAERTMILSAPEFVTETCGILARKGRGKTYLAMVMAEELMNSGYEIPFVVLDPTGCWYGLLVDALGEPSENRVALLGGERGHYPLPATAGKLVASVAVACRPLPLVLDMSLMSQAEQHGFVADFAEELYLKNRVGLHVFVDEADLFSPQRLDKSSKQHGRCLTAVDNLVRRGRFRGIGNTLISQRPAVINKNVLSQVGTMFFLQMLAPQDLDAVGDWLSTTIRGEVRQACLDGIPVLGKGHAYFMRGGDRPLFRKFVVRAKTTFDSSRTPDYKEKGVEVEVGKLSDEDKKMLDEHYGQVLDEAARDEEVVVEGAEADPQELTAVAGEQHGDEPEAPFDEPRALPEPPSDFQEDHDLSDEEPELQDRVEGYDV